MPIKEILNRSYKLAYDEHVAELLSIPEKYLEEVRPNKQVRYSELLEAYNADVARSLNEFGVRLEVETMKALESKGTITVHEKEDVQETIEHYLKPELYLKRFEILLESIDRTLSRYGLLFDAERQRVDIPKSLAEVHAKNTCRKIKAKIFNEIDVFMLKSQALTGGEGFYNRLNHLYNNHQFIFWGAGLAISIIVGALFV